MNPNALHEPSLGRATLRQNAWRVVGCFGECQSVRIDGIPFLTLVFPGFSNGQEEHPQNGYSYR